MGEWLLHYHPRVVLAKCFLEEKHDRRYPLHIMKVLEGME